MIGSIALLFQVGDIWVGKPGRTMTIIWPLYTTGDRWKTSRRFERIPTHKLAKGRYAEWYAGYRIEIAEVTEVYGDGFFDDQFPT